LRCELKANDLELIGDKLECNRDWTDEDHGTRPGEDTEGK
jgi:hypothetical protein